MFCEYLMAFFQSEFKPGSSWTKFNYQITTYSIIVTIAVEKLYIWVSFCKNQTMSNKVK